MENTAMVKMQLILNKRLYDAKQIPRGVYAAANGILVGRLTKYADCSIMTHIEMQ
ncbi:MAG: hypothetical protein FWG72_00205 [Oscillospiraceae bacterium]|nr:hypothetical protein [Oscillospiraceae bacterium]